MFEINDYIRRLENLDKYFSYDNVKEFIEISNNYNKKIYLTSLIQELLKDFSECNIGMCRKNSTDEYYINVKMSIDEDFVLYFKFYTYHIDDTVYVDIFLQNKYINELNNKFNEFYSTKKLFEIYHNFPDLWKINYSKEVRQHYDELINSLKERAEKSVKNYKK